MTPDEIAEIAAALEEGFELLFTEEGQPTGDEMLWVDENGIQTQLIGATEDLLRPATRATVREGVQLDGAGWTSGALRLLTFLKKHLADKAVTISPSGYFLIAGERWDICDEEPVLEALVPLAGIQNLMQVVVRRSVELNSTVAGTEFVYG